MIINSYFHSLPKNTRFFNHFHPPHSPTLPPTHISKYKYVTPHRRRKKEIEYNEWHAGHISRFKEMHKQQSNLHGTDDEKFASSMSIKIDQTYATSLQESIKRVLHLSRITIDETVEIELQMNLDPRKAPEYIRGNIMLPHGSGKTKRVCVFLPESMHAEAIENGADIIGNDALLKEIGSSSNLSSVISFDVIIATPEQLKKLVPYGRQLGPKGLMPNVKLGTLTSDPIKAIQDAKRGQISIRMISGGGGKNGIRNVGVIQGAVGKVSFGEKKITENIDSFLFQLREKLRPPGAKYQYFLKCILSSTQGRSFQVIVDNKLPWIQSGSNLQKNWWETKTNEEVDASETNQE